MEELAKSDEADSVEQAEGAAEKTDSEAAADETAETKKREPRQPNLFWALMPILSMVALMLYVFGFVANADEYDAAHMPLLCAIVVACCVGVAYGRSFMDMLQGMINRLTTSMEAILILLLVGLLISSFMISGTIPALIYYGLDLLTPTLFLPVGCIMCAVVGLACGSSWTATATRPWEASTQSSSLRTRWRS